MNPIKIPVGISDFAKIRRSNYYYIDKTDLIRQLLNDEPAEVTLITRPRRFGKTLGMRMLSEFFDIRKDSRDLFRDLEIAKDISLCESWMNQYPTLFITFKQVDGLTFTSAYDMLCSVIAELCVEHSYLLTSEKISIYDRQILERLARTNGSLADIKNCLLTLTCAMQSHYERPVILLMDEYDVPVAKASSHDYYPEMLDVMKGIMQAFKNNTALKFAVVTGCLRIAKESIFTGTNNFVADTVTHSYLNEYFGFTQKDVDRILKNADISEHKEMIKSWYDGYHFGNLDIYCPWDVMNYLRDLQRDPQAKPASYWKNTSDNAIIRSFIDYAGSSITQKLETLLTNGYISQRIDETLTYDYLHSSEDNLWNILYLTGYLTRVPDDELSAPLPDGFSALTIPNAEIREIFETTVKTWFQDTARSWNRNALFHAVWTANIETITQEMNKLLRKTISYHDYCEDFYHAFLAGIFTGAGYMVESNKEHGEGRSDIVVHDAANGRIAIFEAKYSRELNRMDADCNAALQQINDKMYADEYADDYDDILCYGISFFKKRCLVKKKV
mgnify:FL=1